jgi:hypothetical protein
MSFLLSLFAAVAVQKNVRDVTILKDDAVLSEKILIMHHSLN